MNYKHNQGHQGEYRHEGPQDRQEGPGSVSDSTTKWLLVLVLLTILTSTINNDIIIIIS